MPDQNTCPLPLIAIRHLAKKGTDKEDQEFRQRVHHFCYRVFVRRPNGTKFTSFSDGLRKVAMPYWVTSAELIGYSNSAKINAEEQAILLNYSWLGIEQLRRNL
jgi:hypothetical protein